MRKKKKVDYSVEDFLTNAFTIRDFLFDIYGNSEDGAVPLACLTLACRLVIEKTTREELGLSEMPDGVYSLSESFFINSFKETLADYLKIRNSLNSADGEKHSHWR